MESDAVDDGIEGMWKTGEALDGHLMKLLRPLINICFSGRFHANNNPTTRHPRFINKAAPLPFTRQNEQIDFLKSALESSTPNWTALKTDILNKQGDINQKNVDGVLLKFMITNKKFETALSFSDHLKSSSDQLNLGSVNGILYLYYEIGKTKTLSPEEKEFILQCHNNLYKKYKVLDSLTCERLLHALCVINEWEKAMKVKDDIFLSNKPSHSAYGMLIATLFKNNKKDEAMKLIRESLNNRRPLQDISYEAWINYILNKYKDKKTIIKYLDEICLHIAKNCSKVSSITAEKIRQTYVSLGWNAELTKIRKNDGQCRYCKDTMECLKLSSEEFQHLQKNIKEKLIVGSDLFLKSSPEELKKFLEFVKSTAPYDIVLDALNVSFSIGKRNTFEKLNVLSTTVDHFFKQNKKILVLGKNHMLKWPRQPMEKIKRKTYSFFTEDVSQDDPYFITAAILSGPHTDIVSKDLLRGHLFRLEDEHLRLLFRRWQWQHQWMVYTSKQGRVIVQEPIKFTPYAQKKNDRWHLPFEKEDTPTSQVNDGIPDLSNWICISPKVSKNIK